MKKSLTILLSIVLTVSFIFFACEDYNNDNNITPSATKGILEVTVKPASGSGIDVNDCNVAVWKGDNFIDGGHSEGSSISAKISFSLKPDTYFVDASDVYNGQGIYGNVGNISINANQTTSITITVNYY